MVFFAEQQMLLSMSNDKSLRAFLVQIFSHQRTNEMKETCDHFQRGILVKNMEITRLEDGLCKCEVWKT